MMKKVPIVLSLALTIIFGAILYSFGSKNGNLLRFYSEYSPSIEVFEKLSRGFDFEAKITEGNNSRTVVGVVNAEGFVMQESNGGLIELQNSEYYVQAVARKKSGVALTKLSTGASPATTCIFYKGFYETDLGASFSEIAKKQLATCTGYTDENFEGRKLKRLQLEYTKKVGSLSATAVCDYLFDPEANWRCVEVRSGIKGNPTVSKHRLEYPEASSIFPSWVRLSTITNSVESPGRVYKVLSSKESDLVDSQLLISQFGLPEPRPASGIPSPYLLMLGAFVVFSLAVSAFAYRKIR